MRRSGITALSVCSWILVGTLSAQTPAKVSFATDVLPILRQNCVSCHGPTQQSSGMRLDRKSLVISRRGVVPGSSDNSFLFQRITGNAYQIQMPPTGPLRPEQIRTINATRKAMRELLVKQRPDGGWSDLDSMESGAYATGKSLFALQTAGLPASNAAYQRPGPVPAEHSTGGRLVVSEDARVGIPALLRCRFPSWIRSMALRRRYKLGHYGTRPGVPGANGHRITQAIEAGDRTRLHAFSSRRIRPAAYIG
jgi:Planctomycete cytochrome C